ncbi:hypothetical protein FRB96_009279 [Tulasnella sp. 330]|nr:hypothetical protein FRB96_009279 [Tulasnella sp. 330]KAG8880873.1 hypothetical protein FRB97_000383 [Tulasnella sp. 331]
MAVRSAKPIVLINLFAQIIVFSVQVLFPNRLYDGHVARFLSKLLGLRRVPLTYETEPPHGVILCWHAAVLMQMWCAAMSSKPAVHASLALMEFTYGTLALVICFLYPTTYGSGILLFGALPVLVFAILICSYGRYGVRHLLRLTMGDTSTLQEPKTRKV